MSSVWTCRTCKKRVPRIKQRCPGCASRRPARKVPAHRAVLDVPYDQWVARYGEVCMICKRPPGPKRRLDRDHDHRSGKMRGVLCHRCNRALPDWLTVDWLLAAADYLRRAGA